MRSGPIRRVVLHGPRSVRLERAPMPTPGPGEVVLSVEAATTCGTDLKVYQQGGHPRMLTTPCAFGHEMTGVILAVGKGAGPWRSGDAVVVANSASCGACAMCRNGRENLCEDLHYLNGGFADAMLIPERFVRRSMFQRPAGLEPVLAALSEPLACVFHGLEVLGSGEFGEVAVIGAGPIGLMFCAVLAGAGVRVTVADLISHRLSVAQELGAAHTILLAGDDADVERLRASSDGGAGIGAVVEATGVPSAWEAAMTATAAGGRVLLFGGCPMGTSVRLDTHWLHYSEISVHGAYHHRPETFQQALKALAGGRTGLEKLIQDRGELDDVETMLHRMERREIIKAAIIPRQ